MCVMKEGWRLVRRRRRWNDATAMEKIKMIYHEGVVV